MGGRDAVDCLRGGGRMSYHATSRANEKKTLKKKKRGSGGR